jgi:hypothetical protein
MHNLRDIGVSLQGKFQVLKIISDVEIAHSWYRYMRKFRANDPRNGEKDFDHFSFAYYFSCKLLFSNGVMDGWNL